MSSDAVFWLSLFCLVGCWTLILEVRLRRAYSYLSKAAKVLKKVEASRKQAYNCLKSVAQGTAKATYRVDPDGTQVIRMEDIKEKGEV